MKADALKKIGKGTFIPHKIRTGEEIGNKFDFSKIILSAKTCDGKYHKVNSDAPEILLKNKERIMNGDFKSIVRRFFDEQIHGQRFLIYPKEDQAYLIGNLFFGIKKLATQINKK